MTKRMHEIRDPVHVFVRLDSQERKVLDCWPLQRLRHIHQLSLTYLLYPGATHSRFEHSLGVMELATSIFDTVTSEGALSDCVAARLPELTDSAERLYWRRALRMAALCHDVGHLPFSHAAEEDLLPDEWDHERLTATIIRSNDMATVWDTLTPPLRPDDIVKLALGPGKAKDDSGNALAFTPAEEVLAEIIVGDAFGADRIDYLLRDSLHAGVAYGRFDHFRLVDTLRILPTPPAGEGDEPGEPALGIEEGGLQSAEALLLARYMVYSQVYYHPVRRIYDIHLKDFLRAWLPGGSFPTEVPQHLAMTDNEVLSELRKAALCNQAPGHEPARRIIRHDHFRRVYSRNPRHVEMNPQAGLAVFEAVKYEFGADRVRHDTYKQKKSVIDFPVLCDGNVASSVSVSEVLQNMPIVAVDFVFVDPTVRRQVKEWLDSNLKDIVASKEE